MRTVHPRFAGITKQQLSTNPAPTGATTSPWSRYSQRACVLTWSGPVRRRAVISRSSRSINGCSALISALSGASTVFIMAPCWFLDAPDAGRRSAEATVEIAGSGRGAGFIGEMQRLLSVPARHAMARRIDSGFPAGQVVEGGWPWEGTQELQLL